MDDLISRQQAIDIIENIDTFVSGWRSEAKEKIKNLPSISPTIAKKETVDAISRQQAIEAVRDAIISAEWPYAADVLKSLPSIEPRKGPLTYTKFSEELWGQSAICGLCGCSWQIADNGDDNFCPNCGAKLEEGN